MTSDVAQRGLYKTGDGWVQIVAGEQLRRVRAQAYIANGTLPALDRLPLRPRDETAWDEVPETPPRHEAH